jgi:hypothetical protein
MFMYVNDTGSYRDSLRKHEEDQANMAEQLAVRQTTEFSSHTGGLEASSTLSMLCITFLFYRLLVCVRHTMERAGRSTSTLTLSVSQDESQEFSSFCSTND